MTSWSVLGHTAKVLEAAQKNASFVEASEALLAALSNKAVAAAAVQGPGRHLSTAAVLLYEAAAQYMHAMQGLEVEGEPGGAGWVANFTIMTNRLVAALQQERVQAQVQRALGQVGSPVTPGGILARLLDPRIMNPDKVEAERPWMLDAQQ